MREVGILAVAQLEELLQVLKRVAHGSRVRIRAEELARHAPRAAVVGEAREFLGAVQVEIGKALVVAQQDVVARPVLLDEVVLEDQRLGVGVDDRDLAAAHLAHHRRDLRRQLVGAKIARHAALEVLRLADVENLAIRIEHAVHAGPRRKRGDELAGIERRPRGGTRLARRCGRWLGPVRGHRRQPSAARPSSSVRACANTALNMAGVSRRVWVL